MSYSNLVLPYSIEDSGRKTRFSEDMEIAALLCIAEAERKKKPGLFGKTAETLIFVSKLHYPFWAIPWENKSLLIDAMGNVSNNVLYFKPPDSEAFIEHLKRSTSVQESYYSALRSHSETFYEFTSQTEISMEGFIAEKELLSDMSAFIKDSQIGTPRSVVDTSLMQPKIDKEKAVEITNKVLEHSARLQSEMKGLQFAIDTVNEETKRHVEKLQQELEQTRDNYDNKISNVSIEVEQRKKEIKREWDEKIEKVTVVHEKEVNARLEERKRWEQELVKLEQNKSEYEKRKDLRKRKNDEIGEARWDAKLQDVKNQISTVRGKIKALSDFINRSNKETGKTTKNLNDSHQSLIDQEEKKITDLESSRDLEIEKTEKKIEELRQKTLAIIDKIEKLIDQKKKRSSILKEATISRETETPTLIHVPFYSVQYKAENSERYVFHPPILARGHEGLVMKIRKTLKSYRLKSKIGTLLKPRSKALEKMLTSLENKLDNDEEIQRNLSQLGMSHNVLTSADFKEKLKRGLEELEVEGWIKPEEKTAMLDLYVKN